MLPHSTRNEAPVDTGGEERGVIVAGLREGGFGGASAVLDEH